MFFQGQKNKELLDVINQEAEKKGLNADSVFSAIENAISFAAKEKYGNIKVSVNINKKNGNVLVSKLLMVVDDCVDSKYIYVDNDKYEAIKISQVPNKYPAHSDCKVDSVVPENLPNIDFDRLGVRVAKKAIVDLMKTLEQEKQYQQYKDRVGDVVFGSTRKVTNGGVIVDLGNAEGYMPMKSVIKGESFRQGDRVKAIITSVEMDDRNCRILLSRTSNEFLIELLKQEVPEIHEGTIKIDGVVRDPGSKAKIAVHSVDRNVDPIGSCIGIRSGRVRSIIEQLSGERVDIIVYSPDITEYVMSAITPASAIQAIVNQEKKLIELIMPQDQVSIAIGKGGQNVRLASELVGWNLEILSESDASKKKLEEFTSNTKNLVDTLNVEEIIAQLLFAEGFTSVYDIVENSSVSKLSMIEGFDMEIAEEILKRANDYIASDNDKKVAGLYKIESLSEDDIKSLNDFGISDLESLADLSIEEFNEKATRDCFSQQKISDIIMSARKQLGWFEEEK